MTRFLPARLWIPLVLSMAITAAMLAHAAANRRGVPETIITLTERELGLPYSLSLDSADTPELGLRLRVHHHYIGRIPGQPRAPIDEPTMRALGFSCDPRRDDRTGEPGRDECSREPDRPGYVVLEYDGPAWQAHLSAIETGPQRDDERPDLDNVRRRASRLMVVDAGPDVATLRQRHPDRARLLILAARIAATVEMFKEDGSNNAIPPAERRLQGRIVEMAPATINVPSNLRTFFEKLPEPNEPTRLDFTIHGPEQDLIETVPRYTLRLAIGQRMEPWIVDVRPLP